MEATRQRPRRSVRLTTEEIKAIKDKIKQLGTKYDTALFFGFSSVTLDNILLRGTGREKTVMTIREKLSGAAA